MGGMDGSMMANMPGECGSGMGPQHIEALPVDCMSGMSPEMMGNMSEGCMDAMTPQHMDACPPATMAVADGSGAMGDALAGAMGGPENTMGETDVALGGAMDAGSIGGSAPSDGMDTSVPADDTAAVDAADDTSTSTPEEDPTAGMG